MYLLHSEQDPDQYYVGLTSDRKYRLAANDEGDHAHTGGYRPWRLVVTIEFTDPHRAHAFQRYLKSTSGREFSKRHFR